CLKALFVTSQSAYAPFPLSAGFYLRLLSLRESPVLSASAYLVSPTSSTTHTYLASCLTHFLLAIPSQIS
ncbi:hypothetical protein ACQP3L_38070, partial [Escherichia coli]